MFYLCPVLSRFFRFTDLFSGLYFRLQEILHFQEVFQLRLETGFVVDVNEKKIATDLERRGRGKGLGDQPRYLLLL